MSGVVYAPVGPWWTLDAPSLRLPAPGGDPVSIWTVGEGPSVLLAPRSGGDHRTWLPVLPYLRSSFTLHALEHAVPLRSPARARDVAIALRGLGVRHVVADGDAAPAVLEALRGIPGRHLVVLHAPELPDDPVVAPEVTVRRVGGAGDRVEDAPENLARLLERLLRD